MADRLHVFIEGRVQGVGFRYWTCRQAQMLRLTGWVRNLSDGRVEALFEGPRPPLEEMCDWCRQGPSHARVDRIDEQWESGDAEFRDFRPRG